MKLLLLSPVPPPVGGIASWTNNILTHYKTSKIVNIVHQNTAINHRNITSRGFFSRIYYGSKDALNTILYFVINVSKHKPEVVHLNSSASLALVKDLWIVLIANALNIPLVYHLHFGRIPELFENKGLEWWFLKKVGFFSSSVIVLDDKSCSILKNSGVNAVYNVPNPISRSLENNNLATVDNNKKYIDPSKNIVFVGHIVSTKGVFELLKACSLLNNIDTLTMIGPCEDDIKRELQLINLTTNFDLIFLGVLDKQTVLHKMNAATLLALPSYSEGFPNVIIEAMAMKCPVVATDVGAIPEMLNIGGLNPAGLVVESKNIKALADAINLIITDQELADSLVDNAFRKVNTDYTLESVCAMYDTIWQSVIDK